MIMLSRNNKVMSNDNIKMEIKGTVLVKNSFILFRTVNCERYSELCLDQLNNR